MESIRVVVADDDAGTCELLGRLIDAQPDMSFVGAAGDAEALVGLVSREHPHVALCDVRMPGGGPKAVRAVLQVAPETRLLGLSSSEDRATVFEMLGAGALGYVVKTTSPDEILEAVRRAAEGQSTLSPSVSSAVVTELAARLEDDQHDAALRRGRIERIREVVDRRDGLTMLFQPILELQEGRVTAYEALARFNAVPPRPPDVWFADSELVGLRLDLELAAARMAIRHLPELPFGSYLSVNVSPEVAASPELAGIVNPHAERLVIELTEHAPVEATPR